MRSNNKEYNQAADHNAPEEVQSFILSKLMLPELAKVSTVSKNWLGFFKASKEEHKKVLFKELEDTSICKKITLQELHKKLAPHLAAISRDDKISLFVLLKLIEKKILKYIANSLCYSEDKKQLKITWEEMRKYLTKQFGIAAQFNNMSFDCVIGYNGAESRADEFASFSALNTILKAGKDRDALTLINSYFAKISKDKDKSPLQFSFTNELIINGGAEPFSISELRSGALECCESWQKDKFTKHAADTEKKLLDQYYPDSKNWVIEEKVSKEEVLAAFRGMI